MISFLDGRNKATILIFLLLLLVSIVFSATFVAYSVNNTLLGANISVLAPDFRVVDLTISPRSTPVNTAISVSAEVKNYGSGAFNGQMNTRLRIDINNDGSWDIQPPEVTTGPLVSNAIETETWSGVWITTSDTHKAEVCADSSSTVSESKETNNCAFILFTVPASDFIITSLEYTPASPIPGNAVSFSTGVKNSGGGNVSFTTRTRLRIDENSNGSWDVSSVMRTGPLASGALETETWSNVWTAKVGTHKVEVCADRPELLFEYREPNNCFAQTFTVVGTLVPELALPSVTILSPNGGEILTEGENFLIEWSSTDLDANLPLYITIFRSDGGNASIAQVSASQNSYLWTVNRDLPWGLGYDLRKKMYATFASTLTSSSYGYKIMISQENVFDRSDDDFTIVDALAPITILSPNGGEHWEIGKMYTIVWRFTGEERVGETVDILLENWQGASGTEPVTVKIAENMYAGLGSYTWTVPNITVGNAYRVRVLYSKDRSLPYAQQQADSSDEYFEIATFTTPVSIPTLLLKYFPLGSDGKLDSARTWTSCIDDKVYNAVGANCDLAIIRSWVNKLTNDGLSSLRKASTYKGYKDSTALPYFQHAIVAEKEYLEPMPVTAYFNVVDGDPESGKWSPAPGFVGDYLLIDIGNEVSLDKFSLYFWYIDRPQKFHIDISSSGNFAGEEQRVVTELNGLYGYTQINPTSAIEMKTYAFNATSGRYIKLVVDAWRDGDPEGSNAQINLYELDPGFSIQDASEFSPGVTGFSNKKLYLNKENICNYVDVLGVKEVWVWMYHTEVIAPIESNMAMGAISQSHWNKGTYGDVSNSFRMNDLPVCQHTYTVYEFNYARGLGEMMEDFGHQLEALFHFADNSDSKQPGEDGLFWKRWVGSEYKDEKIYNPGCGWTHYAPNGTGDYDWYNETFILSDCEDWKPDRNGIKRLINCHTWSGLLCTDDGGVAWKTWWMQNIPGRENNLTYQSRKLRNWWEFYVDFDNALKIGKSLVE